MRKLLLLSGAAAILFLATSSVSDKFGSGIAGYTGAPGSFGTCGNCHGGGTSSSSGITLTAVPAFTNNQYMPDSSYKITIHAQAAGFNRFGFGSEILTPSNVNSGTITANFSDGVKILKQGSRVNAVHTIPQATATPAFTFFWKAPSTGTAIVYAMVNAVNGNNSTSGDFPLSPFSLTLTPGESGPQDTIITGVSSSFAGNDFNIFPNPACEYVCIRLNRMERQKVEVAIIGNAGAICLKKTFDAQVHGNKLRLSLSDLAPGYYVLQVTGEDGTLSRRRLWIR